MVTVQKKPSLNLLGKLIANKVPQIQEKRKINIVLWDLSIIK